MKEKTLEWAKGFIREGSVLLDTLQLRIADLMSNEEENDEQINDLQELHDNLEIAISRTEDIIPQLETT